MKPTSFERLGRTTALVAALAFLLPASAAAQDTGTLTGRITDEAGQPLPEVQVSLAGTTIGGLTQANGRFLILNVPAGVYTLEAQRIGYATRRRDNVVVTAGEQTVLDLQLRITALSLEEIVVTGVVDPVEGIKLPFTVGKINPENLQIPVSNNSALAAIQGKVAGVSVIKGSGQPGSGVNIQLRTPTSVQGSSTPMFVVDGVILSSEFGGTTVDLSSLDIESVEVVKGAAAASLYGSRAANGVVQITTKRGSDLQQGQTRFTVRSEFGQNDIPNLVETASSHFYLQAEDGTWVDASGNAVTRTNRVADPDGFQDNPYRNTRLYDNLGRFWDPGSFMTNSVSIAQNTAATNFFATASHENSAGALEGSDGFQKTSFRLNLDHRMRDDLTFRGSVFHSRSVQDDAAGGFRTILAFEPDVDLGLKDADGNYLIQPDPTVTVINPIWSTTVEDFKDNRNRTLASTDLRWTPFNWLRLAGNFSYDLGNRVDRNYVPKGQITSLTEESTSGGQLEYQTTRTETLNGSLDAQLIYNFADLTARTTFRGLFERERYQYDESDGRDFFVLDTPDQDIAATEIISSAEREIRANGFLADLALDYRDRYIGSLLVRRDGSSLFGEDARWNTYYRAAGSWLMAREDWWPFESISEFKLRYAYGTAGNRPSFDYQYETWTVNGTTGAVTKNTLGNVDLKPEYTVEQDLGLDMIIADRYQLRLSYIWQRTEDQIIQLPLPAITGYSSQWTNTGVQSGNTIEAELEAFLVNSADMSWSTTLVADRSRSKIEEWNRSCFFSTLRNICQDAGLGEMWGERFLTSLSQLPADLQPYAEEFQVNDDGYLVWVGAGNSWDEGVSKGLWGTGTEIEGRSLSWGQPFLELEENGTTANLLIGRSEPDVSLGWLNNFRYKGFSVYAHLWAQIGGKVYNNTKQRLYQDFRHADLDQSGKAEGRKKPFDYYRTLYNFNNNSSHFVEDGSFLKLREVSVNYTLSPSQITALGLGRLGASQVTVGLIGRNLLTLTDYTGYDPEVGSVLQRYDSFAYPNLRTVTGQFSIVF